MVASDEGPHRKYYGVTPAGVDTYETWVKMWRDFADAMGTLLDPGGGAPDGGHGDDAGEGTP